MSLINQMLQDLDQRSASGAERGALPNQVRALPRAETSMVRGRLLGVAAAISVAAALAWQFGNQLTPRTPPPAAQAALPAPLTKELSPPAALPPAPMSTETEPTGPASRLALELAIVPSVDNRPAPSDFEAPAAAQKQQAVPPKLSKAVEKSPQITIATESAMSAKQIPNVPQITKTIVAAASDKAARSVVKSADSGIDGKARVALGNPQIDKRSQQLTPRELAENEYRDAANLLGQGRYAEAQEGFQRALQLYPGHIGARQGLFGLLAEAKKNDEAEQVLADGLKLNPNQPGFALALSGLQYQRGDITGAIETLQRTAPAAQNVPEYLARLGALLQRQSRHQEAIDYFQAALRLAPGSGVWLMGLGISQQALNRNSEAQDTFKRAKATRTLNPDLEAFVDQRLKQLR